jgi:hypothetical protein
VGVALLDSSGEFGLVALVNEGGNRAGLRHQGVVIAHDHQQVLAVERALTLALHFAVHRVEVTFGLMKKLVDGVQARGGEEGDHGLKNLNDGDFSCVFGQAQADEGAKQCDQSRTCQQEAVMVRGGFVQAKAEGDRFV